MSLAVTYMYVFLCHRKMRYLAKVKVVVSKVGRLVYTVR